MKRFIILFVALAFLFGCKVGIMGCSQSTTVSSGSSATGGTVKIKGGSITTNPDGTQVFVPDVTASGGSASSGTDVKTDTSYTPK